MDTAQQPVRATVGETFDVPLEGIPTSGYIWELDPRGLPDQVEFLAAEMTPATGQIAGGLAVQAFTFRAVRAGEGRIRFRYRRRWEAEPSRETTITVSVRARDSS
jgi:predicted secreted protein